METTMLALVLCLVMPCFPAVNKPIPLTMENHSVDDMYKGCSEAMDVKVRDEYFPKEKSDDKRFKEAWENAGSCANDKHERKDKELTKDQIQALVVYTAPFPHRDNFHKHFNAAVRDSEDSYTTDAFKYHALHYWLTTALKTLNNDEKCYLTYKRSKVTFEGKQNEEIRFGQFASTSTRPDLENFGNETCFYIKTCHGAPIQDYSYYPCQLEVLIPPYEKFLITEIKYKRYKELECKKIFVLKSAGTQSNLNCKAARKQGNNIVNNRKQGRKRANILTSAVGE